MRRRDAGPGPLYAALLFAGVAALAWPTFVAVATVAAGIAGEGWQLDAWSLEPKRRLLARFVEGWIDSAPFALGIASVALVDHLLLARGRRAGALAGILLPVTGALVALALWPAPMEALPVLAGTGLILAALSRLARLACRRRRR